MPKKTNPKHKSKTRLATASTSPVRLTVPAADTAATLVLTLYDGTRQQIQGNKFLIRIFDGFQNKLFDDFRPSPTTLFRLPYRDNLQDNCTLVAVGDGYVDAGFTPVTLSLAAVAMVDSLVPLAP